MSVRLNRMSRGKGRPRTAKQKAALKKAQIASARARRGTGKAKPTGIRRKAAPVNRSAIRKKAPVTQTNKRRFSRPSAKTVRRVGGGLAAVATVAGGAYVYKNRERLIVTPMAERRFVGIEQRKLGRKLTKAEENAVKARERKLHASRSTDAVRAYREARNIATSNRGKSLNPLSKNYFAGSNSKLHTGMIDDGRRGGPVTSGRFLFELYRKDVNARAEHRLNRIKGKKTGFSYKSGKQKKVLKNGRVVRQYW